jgi:hypothetical protein
MRTIFGDTLPRALEQDGLPVPQASFGLPAHADPEIFRANAADHLYAIG